MRRYVAFLLWLWRDAFVRYRGMVLRGLLADAAGLGLQFGAFFLLYAGVKAFEKNKPLRFVGFKIVDESDPFSLFLAAFIGFLFLVGAALLAYFARRNALFLRRRYEEFCRRRGMALLSLLPAPSAPIASKMVAEGEMSTLTKREGRYSGRLFGSLLMSLLSVASALFYGGVMFYISPLFSAVVLVVSVSGIYFFRLIGSEGARMSRNYERHLSGSAAESRRLSKHMEEFTGPIDPESPLLHGLFSRGVTAELMNAFFGRFIVKQKMALATHLFRAVCIISVLLIAGVGVVAGNWSWSLVVAYLVALKVFSGDIHQVGRTFSDGSRFYPQVDRYRRFVLDAAPLLETSPHGAAREVRFDVPSLEEGGGILRLSPGSVCFLLHEGPGGRAAALLLHAVHNASVDSSPPLWFAGVPHTTPRYGTLKDVFRIPESVSNATIREDAVKLLPTPLKDKVNEIDINEIPSEERDRTWTPEHAMALSLLSAVYSKRLLIMLHERFLDMWGDGKDLQDRLPEGRIIVIHARNVKALASQPDAAPVLVGDDELIVGWCRVGWLRSHPEIVKQAQRKAMSSDDDDDEDDFDDDEE